MKCTACGSVTPEDAQFCGGCGAFLETITELHGKSSRSSVYLALGILSLVLGMAGLMMFVADISEGQEAAFGGLILLVSHLSYWVSYR